MVEIRVADETCRLCSLFPAGLGRQGDLDTALRGAASTRVPLAQGHQVVSGCTPYLMIRSFTGPRSPLTLCSGRTPPA